MANVLMIVGGLRSFSQDNPVTDNYNASKVNLGRCSRFLDNNNGNNKIVTCPLVGCEITKKMYGTSVNSTSPVLDP